jgi:hypothetical protein
VPNPFGSDHASFAAHNNAMLREFLDRFGFQYEFVSASDRYNSGAFDEALRQVLRRNQQILDIMLPTLREERRQTYSPVLPVSPQTGRVLQVPVEVVDAEAGTIRFTDEDGTVVEQSALSGMSKLQWKVDWAMRWYLRAVSRRERREDLQVQGQRPDDRRMADLWVGREPRLLHLPQSQERQAAARRRNPACGGRLLAIPRAAGRAGARQAARQSGVASDAREWRLRGGRGARRR